MKDSRLTSELRACADSGMGVTLWWRDDDAVADTPELQRLLAAAGAFGAQIGLAVIPGRAEPSLVAALADRREVEIWQHGWMHTFHAKGEFGNGRHIDVQMAEAIRGQRVLDELFGSRAWGRVFVPPNHMLAAHFKRIVPALGYRGVSAGQPLTPPAPGVSEVNAEIDVIDWPRRRSHDVVHLEAMVADALRARRSGSLPSDAPLGLLTHHLALDGPGWDTVSRLMERLLADPAVTLADASGLLPDATPAASGTAPEAAPSSRRGGVSVVVTSCGRPDLLERTLGSFLRHNTHRIERIVVMEDGPAEAVASVRERFSDPFILWAATGARGGQIASIDAAYRLVDTEFVFHCEDDWEFDAPGFIEGSLAVLKANPHVLQVWLRAADDTNGHPVVDEELVAEGVAYRLLSPRFDSNRWGTWHGFSWNPGLRRMADYRRLGSYASLAPSTAKSSQVERAASAFYADRGFVAAILSGNEGRGYVRHIGDGRRVEVQPEDRAVGRVLRAIRSRFAALRPT